MQMIIGILTISDRASAGVYEDKSGAAIRDVMTRWIASPWSEEYRLIPDEQSLIESTLCELADERGCSLIVTTGGTGPARRDVTPEATVAVCDRLLPGFGEQMRAVSVRTVPTAILSRQLAGTRGSTLIINLPGKPAAIEECLSAVFAAIPYCVELIGGPRFISTSAAPAAFRPKGARRQAQGATSLAFIKALAVTLPAELLAILVCPKCKSELEYHKGATEALVCRQCRLVYAVQDGIPIMLIDEAKPLNDADFPPNATPAV